MDLKKLSSCMIVVMLVSVGFGMIASDNAQAAFIEPLATTGLPGSFAVYDTAWNAAGTMAVVVGRDMVSGTNAYAFWPHNNTYTPIDNGGFDSQTLNAVDYFRETIYDIPTVLLVDADHPENGLVNYYINVLKGCQAYVDIWDVWEYGAVKDGKPSAEDMAPYDVVIWIPSRDMSGEVAGGALNVNDFAELSFYLNGGGNFFVSNLAITSYHNYGSPGFFTYDYLGVSSYSGLTNYEYGVEPQSMDAVFDGIGWGSQNWWSYGWMGEPGTTDVLYPGLGIGCLRSWDNGMMWSENTGVRYDGGAFKTVYLGFPLETLDLSFSRKLMQRALDWMRPANYGSSKMAEVGPVKDNTIYEGSIYSSNGAGQHLVTGRTWHPANRRALLKFDVSDNIPAYSRIDFVSLTLYCTVDWPGSEYWVSVSSLTSDWGEAGSKASGEEVEGAAAQIGDATWHYRHYDTQSWGMDGGDWFSEVAGRLIGFSGQSYTWSSYDMVMQVQNWMTNPSSNNGWILRGDEWNDGTIKAFASREHPTEAWRPNLSITYSEPAVLRYNDIFWMCGDTVGAPPATVYKLEPQKEMKLMGMSAPSQTYYSLAVDHLGNPLVAGSGLSGMSYYNGSAWVSIPDDLGQLNTRTFDAMDFNPVDKRFYAGGFTSLYFTDRAPLATGSLCYKVQNWNGFGDDLKSLAWNHLYNYGLVGEGPGLYRISSADYYGDGNLRIDTVNYASGDNYLDISWDTDGWNEAAIVGSKSGNMAYWRYYHTNPQLLEGYVGSSGNYYACAFKPPSSPKWVFIPAGSGSVKVNIMEKDQSRDISVNVNFPHIFAVDMWRQADPMQLSILGGPTDANTTYTFFIEGNYTREGSNYWDAANLQLNITAWYDFNQIGTSSVPGDPTWSNDGYRTRQFKLTYNPGGAPVMLYPSGSPDEFSVHSYYEDPNFYGPDNSHRRVYFNITFGQQTMFSPGALAQPTVSPYHPNDALNDRETWDLNVTVHDTLVLDARNSSYAEFGIKKYAAISSWGSPSGSIPPGAMAPLDPLTTISYSINADHKLNVSIPNLVKVGDPLTWIDAVMVQVENLHPFADGTNSDISGPTPFGFSEDQLCIWGQEAGLPIWGPSNGRISAGPDTDYNPGFVVTSVRWYVEVPVGTPEGTYRATVTITLWS